MVSCEANVGEQVLESHPTARATSEQMHDALDTLLQCPIPADWVHVQVHGETVNMRKRCWETLRSMSQEARCDLACVADHALIGARRGIAMHVSACLCSRLDDRCSPFVAAPCAGTRPADDACLGLVRDLQ
eukprot:1155466-Rhodomonas_salina.1